MFTLRIRVYQLIAVLSLSSFSIAASAEPLENLGVVAGLDIRITTNERTGNASFFRIDGGSGLPGSLLPVSRSTPEAVARAFIQRYGDSFGARSAETEMVLLQNEKIEAGRIRYLVKFAQFRAGFEIVGAELAVRLNEQLEVVGANGQLSSEPNEFGSIGDEEAGKNTALGVTAKLHPDVPSSALQVSEAQQVFLNPAIVGNGENREIPAYRYIVENANLSVRQVVIVDFETAGQLLTYSLVHDAKNRVVHDNKNDPTITGSGPIAREEGDPLSGIQAVDEAFDYTGDTYDFFFDQHGRDSLDNSGLLLRSRVRFCETSSDCPYANAFWDGNSMTYGDGFAVDDVVGHELTHGFTQFTSNLIYLNESGAINESFSDVWGELVDLGNGAGSDGSSVRWLLGEDIPGFGAIRDMQNPPGFGDPDRIGGPEYYCGSDDYGGVHSNSGVNNKAATLMVDGGSFNGQTVAALGVDKTIEIYYQAQTTYLTSGSTYADLDLALRDSCDDLIGGTEGITTADCAAVGSALDAVEMADPVCFTPAIAMCDNGNAPIVALFEDFEGGALPTSWEIQNISGNGNWDVSDASPKNGVYSALGDNVNTVSETALAMSSDVVVPDDGFVFFDHRAALEGGYDGGVFEYSDDGGITWKDALDFFNTTGLAYSSQLSSDFSNPFSGRFAFTGETQYASTRLDLSPFAGQPIRFRFSIGTDSSVSAEGWYIDNFSVYSCSSNTTPIAELNLHSSCLAGRGRIDLNIVNTQTASSVYQLEFGSLSAREVTVPFEDRGRLSISGRLPNTYPAVVRRDDVEILNTNVTIDCSAASPPISTPEVTIINACRGNTANKGQVFFQMVNPSDSSRTYVIEFENVPNRAKAAAAFGQALRGTAGRPDGTYDYTVRSGFTDIDSGQVTVDCN